MIIDIILMMQIIMMVAFFSAFIAKHELLWSISIFMNTILMLASFKVQIGAYVFDTINSIYVFKLVSYTCPIMMGINLMFLLLSLWLMILDLFDKYGISVNKFKNKIL